MFTAIVFLSNIILAASALLLVGSHVRKPFQAVLHTYSRNKNAPVKSGTGTNAQGIVFGKSKSGKVAFSPTTDEGHCAIFGGTDSGKTSSILIPTLRHWSGTSFTVDISGDISSHVDFPNKLIYEPGNPASAPYDVFSAIDAMNDPADQNEALAQLAHLLIPVLTDASANAQYFQSGGRKILTAALIAYYHQGMDFIPICRAVLGKSYTALFGDIDASGNEIAMMYISGFEGNNPQNISSCKDNCDDALRLFAVNTRVASSIRRAANGETAFCPQSIETHNVFALIPDAMLKVYAPLLRIIISQSLTYFADRPTDKTHSILFCLDEFVSFGKIDISSALRKLRKKHIRIIILTQSLADIEEVYGKDRYKVILDNCSFTAILRVTEPETAEFFSKMIGREYKPRESVTSSNLGSVISRTQSTEKDYIIAPADLAHLDDSLILLHPDGYTVLKKAYYWKN